MALSYLSDDENINLSDLSQDYAPLQDASLQTASPASVTTPPLNAGSFLAGRFGGVVPASYYKNLDRIESGGRSDATNPMSTAKGNYQIIDPTLKDIQRLHPELAGKGVNDLAVITALTEDNAKYLNRRLGRAPTEPEIYAAHRLGAHGGARFIEALQSNPNAPAISAVNDDQVKANYNVFFDNTGQPYSLKQVYDRAASQFGNDPVSASGSGRVQYAQAATGSMNDGMLASVPGERQPPPEIKPPPVSSIPVPAPPADEIEPPTPQVPVVPKPPVIVAPGATPAAAAPAATPIPTPTPAAAPTPAATPASRYKSADAQYAAQQAAMDAYTKGQPEMWKQLERMRQDYLRASKPSACDSIEDGLNKYAQQQAVARANISTRTGHILNKMLPSSKEFVEALQNAHKMDVEARTANQLRNKTAYDTGSGNMLARMAQEHQNLTASGQLTKNRSDLDLDTQKAITDEEIKRQHNLIEQQKVGLGGTFNTFTWHDGTEQRTRVINNQNAADVKWVNTPAAPGDLSGNSGIPSNARMIDKPLVSLGSSVPGQDGTSGSKSKGGTAPAPMTYQQHAELIAKATLASNLLDRLDNTGPMTGPVFETIHQLFGTKQADIRSGYNKVVNDLQMGQLLSILKGMGGSDTEEESKRAVATLLDIKTPKPLAKALLKEIVDANMWEQKKIRDLTKIKDDNDKNNQPTDMPSETNKWVLANKKPTLDLTAIIDAYDKPTIVQQKVSPDGKKTYRVWSDGKKDVVDN